MLLMFKCPNSHLTKKISDKNVNVIECSCGMLATKSKDGFGSSEILDIIDNGFMTKKVEYSEKNAELAHEQSVKHSKFIRDRLGLEEDEF